MSELQLPVPAQRPIYFYTLPERISAEVGVKVLGLVELTSSEEMMATRRAAGDPIRLAWELPKESLRSVDGKALGSANGSIDQVWENLHPKVRTFVLNAYNSLHSPSREDMEGFLQSRQVQV